MRRKTSRQLFAILKAAALLASEVVPCGTGIQIMKTAQNVYQRFVQFEEDAAAIYLKLASRFLPENPELGSLWLEQAMEEKEHAGLLQFCLAEQMFAEQLVNHRHIRRISALFQNLARRAADPAVSVDEAFLIAAEMEASEVNDIWLRLTTPVHKSMYLVRKKIASAVPNHLARLVEAGRKFGVGQKAMRELERLTAHDKAA
jgi:rubrerythrin